MTTIDWMTPERRAPDLAQSAAVSYLLLFVTLVLCASFFNLVVLKQRAARA
jgi:hypothetical protein